MIFSHNVIDYIDRSSTRSPFLSPVFFHSRELDWNVFPSESYITLYLSRRKRWSPNFSQFPCLWLCLCLFLPSFSNLLGTQSSPDMDLDLDPWDARGHNSRSTKTLLGPPVLDSLESSFLYSRSSYLCHRLTLVPCLSFKTGPWDPLDRRFLLSRACPLQHFVPPPPPLLYVYILHNNKLPPTTKSTSRNHLLCIYRTFTLLIPRFFEISTFWIVIKFHIPEHRRHLRGRKPTLSNSPFEYGLNEKIFTTCLTRGLGHQLSSMAQTQILVVIPVSFESFRKIPPETIF